MDETVSLPKLPPSWCIATLQEVSEVNPSLPIDNITNDDQVSFLPMKAVEEESGRFDASAAKKFIEVKKGYTPFVDGDVIFAKITPCMENGKAAVVEHLINGIGFGSTEFHVLRPVDELLLPQFLFFYVVQKAFRREAQTKMTGSAGQKRVPTAFIQNAEIPLPPLPEQHRIVTKIEELFTKLDAGIDALKKAQAQLGRYRQAILKAAVTGELTREWREAHRGEVEPAADLLTHILTERRAKWEADQLAKMQAAGKQPKNDDWKQKYQESTEHDTSVLTDLPEGWKWISLEQLAWDASYGTSAKCDYEFSGIPVLRIPNIAKGKIDLSDLKFASLQVELNEQDALKKGDLLVIRTNGSKSLIGRAALINENLKQSYSFASYLIRFRLVGSDSLLNWISIVWHSPRLRTWIESKAATSAGQHNISLSTLNRLALELPPLAEQQQIIAEVERLLSIADAMEQTIKQSIRQAERLRQSILQQAFAGQLVLQDPNDEPASRLLERMREERAREDEATPTKKRKSSKHKQANQTSFFG